MDFETSVFLKQPNRNLDQIPKDKKNSTKDINHHFTGKGNRQAHK